MRLTRSNYPRAIERYGFPVHMRGELVQLFERNNAVPSRRRWSDALLSTKTEYRRFVNLCATLRELAGIGYPIESIHNLKEKHVQALMRHWESSGAGIGTIENKMSYLRTLCKWLGKPGMVKGTATYCADPKGFRRPAAAQWDKSWEAAGIDPLELLERAGRHDRIVALQLELQWAFGLRMLEACLLRPALILEKALESGEVHIHHGTKGGRPRGLYLESVVQRDVLERAARHAVSRTGTMIPREYTLEQWRNHYYYVVRRKCALTKEDAGVTSHGARHSYLQRKFEQITGKPAPVKGGHGYDPERLELAMSEVAELAGHGRVEKSQAYLGAVLAARRRGS